MITQSLIPEILRDFNYYRNKLPLYLKSSKTFQEHFRIWYEVLVGSTGNSGIVGNAEILLNMLNIFADDYFDFLATVEGSHPDDVTSDILDKIGNLYGVSRFITVSYTLPNSTVQVNDEQLVLTNAEFLILIKARIVQNYCDGSLKQINEYYQLIGLPIVVKTLANAPATAELYLLHYTEKELDNNDKMFLSGLLKIESMGINYRQQILIPDKVLVWDEINATNTNGWYEGKYTHNIHLVLRNQAQLVDTNIVFTDTFEANQFNIKRVLSLIEILGGEEGYDATGTCVDGFGHSGPISKLKYTSSTNALAITFTDATAGTGTVNWLLSGQYPPTSQSITDSIDSTIIEGGNWVI